MPAGGHIVQRPAVENDAPARRWVEARQRSDERGLPCAVWAEQGDGLTCGGLERRGHGEVAPASLDVDDQAHRAARNRSRRPTITASDTPTSSSESAIAPSGSVWSRSNTASGSVCVRPWRFPANVMVAPNSPSALAQHSTSAAAICGASMGSVTRRSTYQREPPSVAAASSSRESSERSPASSTSTASGNETNAAASTAADVATTIDRRSAVSEESDVSTSAVLDHGVRWISPARGSVTNAIPRMARTTKTAEVVRFLAAMSGGRKEPERPQRGLPRSGHEAEEGPGDRRAAGTIDHRDRVRGDDVHVVGDGDLPHAGRDVGGDIGPVDDAGVGLTQEHLLDDSLHVLLVRHEVGQCPLLDARVRQDSPRVITRGSPDGGQDQLDAGPSQVVERSDMGRVIRRDDDRQLVPGELDLVRDPGAVRPDLVHVFRAGRSEDVGWPAFQDLGGQPVRRPETESNRDVRVDLLEVCADPGEGSRE